MSSATIYILKYEWKAFTRNPLQMMMLGVTFLFGLYAIYYGYNEIASQKSTIEAVRKIESNEFHQYQESFEKEINSLQYQQEKNIATEAAFAWHRHGYHAVLVPSALAPLAIGQRDLLPFYYRLTGMSLYYQLFQNEIANPLKLLVGNFDLSFLLVYIFPLLIIAFSYALLSGEKESGILSLLKIQSVRIRKILLCRMTFYFIIISSVAFLLSITGFLVSGAGFQPRSIISMLFWLLTILCYFVLWFSLMFFIISWNNSSAFNAITGAGFWLLFLVVVPAVLNVVLTSAYPVNSMALAEIVRRNALENENDQQEVKEVIAEYLHHKPGLLKTDTLINTNLLAKAYAAFSQLNDINHRKMVEDYNQKVRNKNDVANYFNLINPAVNTQNIFTLFAETDLTTYLRFQTSLTLFHGQIIDFYYPKLFNDKLITASDYQRLPTFTMATRNDKWKQAMVGLLQILLLSSGLFLGGYKLSSRKTI